MIGTQLGNYRVTARLGEGGMGTVYRAVDTMLDRDVALKVLRPELARQEALVERFRAEAVALARLRHDHIAALYGLDRQGDDLVMVMEYVSGETLEATLARHGAMPWQQALPILRGVLAALSHAHTRGVVHRDIKPANVMIDAEGQVKVMDFGIARLMGENRQTRAGVAIGTPSYMAPEQLRGEDVDGRTDLYAAGALLFELVTGRVAFQADSDYSLMMQQLHEPPAAPSSVTRGVPKALDQAVSRAMAKKPAQRFESATAFARALDDITPDAPSADAMRDAATALVARAPRDWRMYAIAACVVATVGIGAAALRGGRDVRTATPSAPDSAGATQQPFAPRSTAGIADTDTAKSRMIAMAAAAATAPGVRELGAETARPIAVPAPVPATAPRERTVRTPTPVRASDTSTTRAPRTPVAVATPSAPVAPEAKPAREAESSGTVSRRVEDLAERCTQSIASNNAATAGRLLHGDDGGLMSAISDGRIVSATSGNVSVNASDASASGAFTVRVAWRTAFGGNKNGVARLTAEVARGSDGWRAAGCTVESGGGVR
jgi:eukaryotic-like serine/threonine-protein kinase